MPKNKTSKTIEDINRRIKQGKVVVVTADEMTDIVKLKGAEKAAREVDVVTTGTFAPMCSSGAFINFGHTKPATKASEVWHPWRLRGLHSNKEPRIIRNSPSLAWVPDPWFPANPRF